MQQEQYSWVSTRFWQCGAFPHGCSPWSPALRVWAGLRARGETWGLPPVAPLPGGRKS